MDRSTVKHLDLGNNPNLTEVFYDALAVLIQ